jgi:hypothetical protein
MSSYSAQGLLDRAWGFYLLPFDAPIGVLTVDGEPA